jgi:large-conductance mechanosensitive channel
MSSSKDEARRNFLNALKAIALEGSLRDWLAVMVMLSVPYIFATNFSALVDSVSTNLFVPLIFHPILKALSINRMSSWTMGWFGIGALVSNLIAVVFNLAVLFGLTRLLRRFI